MDSKLIILHIVGKTFELIITFFFFYFSRIWVSISIIGEVSAFISKILIFSFINQLGVDIAHLKIYSSSSTVEDRKQYNGTLLFLRIIQTLSYSSIVIFIFFFTNLNTSFNLIGLILIFSIIIQFFFSGIFIPIFLSQKKILKSFIPLLIGSGVKMILLSIYYINNTISLNSYISIFIFSNLSVGLSFFLLARGTKYAKPTKFDIKKYLNFASPFIFSSISYILMNNITIIFIDKWFSPQEVANYGTAIILMNFINQIPPIINQILITTFAQDKENNQDITYKKIYKTHQYLSIILGFLIIISFLFSKFFFIYIFGNDYSEVGDILSLLLLGKLCAVYSTAFFADLQAKGKTKFSELMPILHLLIFIICSYYLISPEFLNLGLIGAGLSYIISMFLYTSIFDYIACKKYGYVFFWGVGKIILIIVIIYSIQYYLISLVSIGSLKNQITKAIFTSIMYIVLLYIFRLIKKEDIILFKIILNPKEMIKMMKLQIS